jgi:hypothetical protein
LKGFKRKPGFEMMDSGALKATGVSETFGQTIFEGLAGRKFLQKRENKLFSLTVTGKKLNLEVQWNFDACARNSLLLKAHKHTETNTPPEENEQRRMITKGMVLARVDGENVAGLTYKELKAKLGNTKRPLDLQFKNCDSLVLVPPSKKKALSKPEPNRASLSKGQSRSLDDANNDEGVASDIAQIKQEIQEGNYDRAGLLQGLQDQLHKKDEL